MKHLKTGFVLILILLSRQAVSSNIIILSDTIDNRMLLYEDLEYLEDNNYSIEDVSVGAAKNKFYVNRIFAPNNTNLGKAYWIRIRIKGNPEIRKKWILEFYDQTTDLIEAYLPTREGLLEKIITGDELDYEHRRFQHKNFQFEIDNFSSEVKEYYFRVFSKNPINIIIVLRSIDYFIYYALNEYFLYGLFYGMILIIAIYNFLIYLAIRETQYISYILYLLSVLLYFMCLDGIAYQYLWPHSPSWNRIAHGVTLFSLIIWSLIFTKQFLHANQSFPVIKKLVNLTILIRSILFVMAIFLFPILLQHRWMDMIPLSISLFSGIYAYRKGYKAARFFVGGYALLFIGFIIRIILNLNTGIIPSSIFAHYSINLAFLGEMLLLSFALADKVRILKSSRDTALQEIIREQQINVELKDKVNKELESEVKKRTLEIENQKAIIEEANEKLKVQAEEIKKINQFLDKDNFQLKGRVKEKMLERAARKNMDFSEFKMIFPDDVTCLRYLEERKWGNNQTFYCKKCRNDKCITGAGKFDRRCTRCGYNESPTAYTIFHGIKFPIVKAFYILHLVIHDRDDLTLDQISERIELRKNTCGSFRRKVLDVIEKKKGDKAFMENWDNIIFSTEGNND